MIVGVYNMDISYVQVWISLEEHDNNNSKSFNTDVPNWAMYLFTALAVCGVLFMIIVICAIIRGAINDASRIRI